MNKTEVWKPVKGYEGYYEVSNQGRVKSLVGWNGHKYVNREKIISGWKQKTSKDGSYQRFVVRLKKNGKGKELKVHRITAEAFIPNIGNKPNINHIDGNPLNNKVENLEWCTQKENVEHAVKTGLIKVSAYQNKEELIELYKEGHSIKELSKRFVSNEKSVRNVLNEAKINIKGPEFYQNKYFIDKEQLVKDLKSGMSNLEIAKKHKTNNGLIATYKYQLKKGIL